MTLTRWKLMAGVLGISIAGVVAMASPQCPNTNKDSARETAPPGRPVTTPVVVAAKQELPPKVESKPLLPLVETFPVLPAVVAGPKLELPSQDVKPTSAPKFDLPTISPLPPVTGSPPPDLVAKADPPKIEFPKAEASILSELPTIKGIDLPNTVPVVATPKAELPKVDAPPKPERVVELPLPGVTAPKPIAPVVDLPVPQEIKPLPASPPVVAAEKPAAPQPRVILDEPPPAAPLPKFEPKKVEATPTKVTTKSVTSEESAVRIVIHLGTGQPKFDVMAGDDALLKAVCNNIDIRSPNENGAGVTPLKAGGKVQFSAPGCEGTCDSLTVLPTTGEVELSGNVKVHTRLGKGSTEINATTMKFKLGSAPAYSVPEPGVTPVSGRQ